jgi:hypothetical protein
MREVGDKVGVEWNHDVLGMLLIQCRYNLLHDGDGLDGREEELVPRGVWHAECFEQGSENVPRGNQSRTNLGTIIPE